VELIPIQEVGNNIFLSSHFTDSLRILLQFLHTLVKIYQFIISSISTSSAMSTQSSDSSQASEGQTFSQTILPGASTPSPNYRDWIKLVLPFFKVVGQEVKNKRNWFTLECISCQVKLTDKGKTAFVAHLQVII
jgi:hypothetical protein